MLRNTQLTIEPGQFIAIVGRSGCGKSTLLRLVAGLEAASEGELVTDGHTVQGLHHDTRIMFQEARLLPWRRVLDNVTLGLPAEAKPRGKEVLAQVGLAASVGDLSPAELSGGMQKRVGLARAIAAEPEIIFFDEPTTGLDPIMSGVINDLIREIVVEMGATAMTITHDMSSVRAIADNVAMLHGGVIRWTGPVGEMDATPDAYVQQFIHGRADGPIESVR